MRQRGAGEEPCARLPAHHGAFREQASATRDRLAQNSLSALGVRVLAIVRFIKDHQLSGALGHKGRGAVVREDADVTVSRVLVHADDANGAAHLAPRMETPPPDGAARRGGDDINGLGEDVIGGDDSCAGLANARLVRQKGSMARRQKLRAG